MNKLITRLAIVSALATFLSAATLLPAAEIEKAPKEKKSATEKKTPAEPKGTVYRGTVAALDKTAMTITVTNKSSSRVFQITSDTHFFKKDKPATLADLVVGDVVGGSYLQSGEKLNLLNVRDAGPDAKAAKQAEKKAEKAEKKAEIKAELKAEKRAEKKSGQ